MSATKATQKWVKTATVNDLHRERDSIDAALRVERNPLRRSSFTTRREIVISELARRLIAEAHRQDGAAIRTEH